jgi:hypothetical protein
VTTQKRARGEQQIVKVEDGGVAFEGLEIFQELIERAGEGRDQRCCDFV